MECTEEIFNEIKTNLINTTNQVHYNNWNNRTNYGYHSFQINNEVLLGQRRPWIRLDKMKEYVNFTDKTIIDFGCNTGGMIFHLPKLKKAIGFDFDKNCINTCNYISSVINNKTDYLFLHQDLNDFNLSDFMEKNKMSKVDIIFLLSLGSWIHNWKELYKQSIIYSDVVILETNNDMEGKPQLKFFQDLKFKIQMISDKSDDDTTNNIGRKTYLITK